MNTIIVYIIKIFPSHNPRMLVTICYSTYGNIITCPGYTEM